MGSRFYVLFTLPVIAICSGCTQPNSTSKGTPTMASESKNTPEDAYRNFMLANLSGQRGRDPPSHRR